MIQAQSEYSPPRYSDANLAHVLNEKGNSHQHSRFTDVSAKGHHFESMDFSYCVFIRAYFHNTTFVDCRFVGAHFIRCNFRNAQLRSCDFSYASFDGTRLPPRQILENLPAWPNVRRELLQILRRNAASVGDYKSERLFIIREIDSEKEHWRRAWKQEEPYYKKKYGHWSKWIAAGFRLFGLRLDSFMWGHGERIWKAIPALLVFLLLASLLLTINWLAGVGSTTPSTVLGYFSSAFVYHTNMLLGLSDTSSVQGILLIDWLVVIVRYVLLGVIVAALYRRLAHR